MQIYLVKLGLLGLTPTALVEKGRTLVQSCTGNANITLPPAVLTDLSAACDALEVANIAVRDNGGRMDTLVRDARVTDLEELIRALAGYVQAQCDGDQEKITSTGFGTRRRPSPIGVVDAPGNLRAVRGKLPGEVQLRWDGVRGRLLYVLFHTNDPNNDGSWKMLAQTSKNFYTATGLASDQVHYFRTMAIGAAGEGPVSDNANSKAA